MRLLFVADHNPWPSNNGGCIRNANLLAQLRKRWDVRLAVLDRPTDHPDTPRDAEFFPMRWDAYVPPSPRRPGWGERLEVLRDLADPRPDLLRPFDTARTREELARLGKLAAGFDVVWVCRGYFTHLAGAALAGRRVVTDFVDVEYEGKRPYADGLPRGVHKWTRRADLLKLLRVERAAARRSWRVVVCKAEDRDLLVAHRQGVVVPNGTAVQPDLSGVPHDADRLLFTGTMNYPPNVDAACWFAADCSPRVDAALGRQARFDVVGRDPAPEVLALARDGRVVVHGTVPELTEYYRRAAVVVAPIRVGAGTKLKVLEALAFGKALVATSEAVRGHGLRAGVDYLHADTPPEFAAACVRLLGDAGLRAALGRAGRERVLHYHTWDSIGDRLNRALTPSLESEPVRHSPERQ